MEQNPSPKSNSSSASHHIPSILWIPKFHYRIQNSPLSAPILDRINPVRTSPFLLFATYVNIILPSTPRSTKRSLDLQKPSMHFYSHPHVICPYHLNHLDFITLIIFCEVRSFPQSPVASLLLGPNDSHSIRNIHQ
jgi:hypothetical protein